MKQRRIITYHFLDVARATVMTQEITHRASRQYQGTLKRISGMFVLYTSHSDFHHGGSFGQ